MFFLILGVLALFAVLTVARLGGARRADILERWPAAAMGLGAAYAAIRGRFGFALGLAGAALLTWLLAPAFKRPAAAPARPAPDPRDQEARATLGVGPQASDAEIRAAYRAKMARAHPDLGGSHAEAARLAAARDRLLKR